MVLFIDTHLNDIVIILYKNGKIYKKKIIENEPKHSTLIMPTLVDILNGIIPSSIIVVNGPGSFTGVRLGVTIAKTLAYTMNIPIRTINYLECLAVSSNIENKIVGFCDNNGYYVGKFNENNKEMSDLKYLNNKEFEKYNNDSKVLLNIKADYEKIIAFALRKKTINPHKVNPIYVKKLDVEK